MSKIIGRAVATEKYPATRNKFYFWTDSEFRLNAFDGVKVEHLEGSYSFGTVENIYHITDAKNIYTPVINDSRIYLATTKEIERALGLDKIQNPLPCGFIVKAREDSVR